MSFSIDYCCEQIEKVQTEVLVDQLRRLAAESVGRLGSRGNTARLLRVIAARLERDSGDLVAELQKRGKASHDKMVTLTGCGSGQGTGLELAADIVAEKLVCKK